MRNKKGFAALIAIAALLPALVFAQGAISTLPDPGLTPDSPLYFLKEWREGIQLFFTFGAEAKAKQYLHLAEVRLAEYQKMVEKGKQEIAERTIVKYQDQLDRAVQKAQELKEKGIGDIIQKVEEATVKHLQVLQDNLAKVPEAAKKGLEKAIEASRKGVEKIREALEKKQTSKRDNEASQRGVMNKFLEQWPSLQKQFPYSPVLGSIFWTVDDFQFIGNNALLVAFEDGHVALAALFKYDLAGSAFNYLKSFKDDFPFTLAQWQGIIREYGDENYETATYTKGVVRDGKIINFQDWTKVPENHFLHPSSSSETSTWETYRNEKDVWEIKLPPDYYVYNPSSPLVEKAGFTLVNLSDVTFYISTFQGLNVRDASSGGGLAFATLEIRGGQTKPAGITMLQYVRGLNNKSARYSSYFEATTTDFNSIKEVTLNDGRMVVEADHFVFEGCPTFSYWFERNPREYARVIVSGLVRAHFCTKGLNDTQWSQLTSELKQVISTFKFIEPK